MSTKMYLCLSIMNNLNYKQEFRCGQSWENMKQADAGRHCGHCQRTVFDFTDKSEEEIAAQFKAHNGRLCGSFNSEQLEYEVPVRSWSPKVFLASLAAIFTLTTTRVIAQTATPVKTEQRDSSSTASAQNNNDVVNVPTPTISKDFNAHRKAALKDFRRRHGTTLFYIGNVRFSVSRKFPLFHIRKSYRLTGAYSL